MRHSRAYLVVEVGRGSGQHAAVGPEHLPLHLDGEVTQPALLPLPVQIIHHCSAGTREAHVHSQTGRGAQSRIHGHAELWRRAFKVAAKSRLTF